MRLYDVSKNLHSFDFKEFEKEKEKERPVRKKLSRFQNLFEVVQQFYFSEEVNKTYFDLLSKVEKKLLFFLLKKLFQKEMNKKEVTYEIMKQLQNMPSRKRNEEKIKQIWKRFLRKIYEDFKRSLQREDKRKRGKSKNTDQWKQFYVDFAEKLIMQDPVLFNRNLIMDICTEKTINLMNSKKNCELTQLNNWKTLHKISAMKKISASFRFMVSKSSTYSQKFKSFLDLRNQNGILGLMRDIISNKLSKLFVSWETSFNKKRPDKDTFLKEVEVQIKKKKFKLPWLISNVKNSVEHCLEDINHKKLSRKFKNIQKSHYSFIKAKEG